MKKILTALLLMVGSVCMAQNATDFFNSAGNQFIDGNTEQALNTVNRGLKRYPGDEKLTKLLEELQKQQEQEQQQKEQQQQQEQDQKEQDQKDQQQKDDQQKQDQQNKDDQQKQDQEQQKQEDQEQKQEDQEGKENEEQKEEQQGEEEQKDDEQKQKDDLEKFLEKLKEMKISPEKAQMILEAMKNNEIKYLQQKKRKATKRKDRTKPDW